MKNGIEWPGKAQNSSRRGFTLVELIVVIAIIGILSAVILGSLNNSRAKARDAKRIADIKQIQLSLELYSDLNGGVYPNTLNLLSSTGVMNNVPVDPVTNVAYFYSALSDTNGGLCVSYHLGANLEYNNQANFSTDDDMAANAAPFRYGCAGATADFSANNADTTRCDGTAGGYCYDVRP